MELSKPPDPKCKKCKGTGDWKHDDPCYCGQPHLCKCATATPNEWIKNKAKEIAKKNFVEVSDEYIEETTNTLGDSMAASAANTANQNTAYVMAILDYLDKQHESL